MSFFVPLAFQILFEMDEREIEQGYAGFHRKLNRVLRSKDVRAFKAHVAAHPGQAGKLSHCLGLNDQLAEIEMYKAILNRSPLKDLHNEARQWLVAKGIDPPQPRISRKGTSSKRKRKRPYAKNR
jgi:hypothetical protein